MRVLVTGGAGFIGSHIVDQLVDLGWEVVSLDALLPAAHRDSPGYLNPQATFLQMDLQDLAGLKTVVADVDHVCHQAAMVGLGTSFGDTVSYVANNDVATATLLQALDATGFSGRLVLASSMVVYGEGAYSCPTHGPVRPPPRTRERLDRGLFEPSCPGCENPLAPEALTESTPPDPRNVYAATKLHQEHLCHIFGRVAGVDVTSLRYHNVYGPRMPRDTPYAGVASIFRSALAAGRAPRVFEDGRQRRDFVHVRDVARANLLALTSERPVPGVFNIASGEPHSVGEMAAALAAAMGAGGPKPTVTGDYRLGDVRHVFASPNKAAQALGWRAEVPFEVGMEELAGASLRPGAGSLHEGTKPRIQTAAC